MSITKTAFVYLSQNDGSYYLADNPGYSIQRRPQLGLQYLCAVLEKKGIRANIFDQTVHNFGLDWLIQELRQYDMVGFYCSDAQEEKVKAWCVKIKERIGIPVLVGGPSTFTKNVFLDYGCDIIVHGEGEVTIQQIVDYYNDNFPIENIKGISYKQNGKIIRAQDQDLIENLDEIPFPDRSKVDINAYHDFFLFGMKKPYTAVMTSRGCVNACHFCVSHKLWRGKYRRRSVDNVILEIDELVRRHNIKYVSFHDDVFVTSNVWVEEFCGKLVKKDYKIKWIAVLHPFSIARDREGVLKLMKAAGCDALSFGLQSAHPEVLKGINRHPLEPEKLREIIQIANKLDLLTMVFYIFGLPGDTIETIRTSIDYSLSCGSTFANYFSLTLLEGSELKRLYKDTRVCSLAEEEIRGLTRYASRKFYTNPGKILRILYFMIRNPLWPIRVGLKLPQVLARIGLLKG